MGATVSPPPALSRIATVAVVALMILGSGVALTIRAAKTGLAPTGTNSIWRLQNGSGSQVGVCFDNGNCRFSGSIIDQGAGASTFPGGISGSTIHAEKTLTSSGSAKVLGNITGSTLGVSGTTRMSSGIIITRSNDIGWSVQAAANQACNTTCTSACVFGEDTSVLGSFVSCSDATADRCVCAGGN